MNILFTIFTATLGIIIGYLVIKQNPRNAMHLAFMVFCVSLAFWAVANYFSISTQEVSNILFWMRAVMIFAVIICISFFLFIHTFPKSKINLQKKYLFPLLLAGVLTCIVSFSPLLFSEVTFDEQGNRSPVVKPGMLLFLIVAVGSLLSAFIILIKKVKRSTGITKMQLRFILAGTFIMFFCILLFNLVLPVIFKISTFVNAAPFFILPFILAVFYAITRHRLMDIRLVVKRTAIYASTVIFLLLLALGLYWLEMTYFKEIIPPGVWGPIVLLLGLILFEPLKNYLERIANKYFFASIYNYQATLEKLAQELTYSIDLDQIIDSIVKTIRDTMKLDRTGVLLFDQETHNYQVKSNIGFSVANGISLVRNNFLTNYLLEKRKPVIYQELESLKSNQGEKSEIGKLKANMKRIEAALCLPLIIKNKLIGIIVLGEKISKDAYTKEDLQLLDSLTNQASIALENARLYQQVQDFTKTLQQKVDEQTRDIKQKNVDLKKMAKEVKEKNVHLEKVLKIQSEFLDISSHQLRTPVSVIKGVSSMLAQGEMEKLPPEKKKEFYQSVYDKSVKLEKIINDILRASEFDAVKFSLDDKTALISPEEVIEEAVKEAELEAKQRKINLIWQKPVSPLPKIYAKKKYLVEAIGNLLSNALKYTPSLVQVKEARSKRRKKGVVMVEAEKEKDNILIKVSDNGIGIPKKEISKLFTKFARAENATDMYTDGSGLGLFIVKEIVSGHQGQVWLESKLGKGTTFYISLPIAKK
ncbi:MAG: ATP-binding protein [Patescibacteria group bacterium]|nr:ATP-binding protein [Patescibacteria group bacterium]